MKKLVFLVGFLFNLFSVSQAQSPTNPKDVGVTSINPNLAKIGVKHYFTTNVTNFSNSNLTSVVLKYRINNGSWSSPVVVSGPFTAGNTVIANNLPPVGISGLTSGSQYLLEVCTYPDPVQNNNNCKKKTVTAN